MIPITVAVAALFFLCALIPYQDNKKSFVAWLFFFIHFINIFEDFHEFDYYYTNIAACFALVIITLSVSLKNWAFAIAGVLALSTVINVLGIIGESLKIEILYNSYQLLYLTTFMELAVLVRMTHGMDGYMADYLRLSDRKYCFRNLSAMLHCKIHSYSVEKCQATR